MSLTDLVDTSSEGGHSADVPGVTLKRLRDGRHAWEVNVVAAGASIEEMREAVEVAKTIDAELAEIYDEPEEEPESAPRPRRSGGQEFATEKQLRFIAKLGKERGLHIDAPASKADASVLIQHLLGGDDDTNGARS